MSKTKVFKFLLAVLICQAAGGIGSIFTTPAVSSWYAGIKKPSFNPPNWIFGPVWIFLFLLMGVSLYLVWRAGWQQKEVKVAIIVFSAQLVLNIVWSLLFFGLKSPLAAFVEIIILWLAILLTIVKFCKISPVAGLLLLPYIFWVTFAAFLNFSIWRLN